jgi:hypothetical protein
VVTTAKRRSVVAFFKSRGHSERCACALAIVHRTTCRYKATRVDDEMLLGRLRELASERPRFGYRRLQGGLPSLPRSRPDRPPTRAAEASHLEAAAGHRMRAAESALVDGLRA